MQGNPFYIDPFGGYGGQIVEGLSGLGAVLGERQKMKQAEEKRKTVGLEASRLLREGTPDEVYQFSLQNPEISKMIDDRMGYLNKESRQNAFQTALQISQGANPIDAYGKRIEYLKSIGANPAETMQELEDAAFQYTEDPEGYRNLVARTIPAAFMPEYGEYRKVMNQGQDEVTFQQGTGPMAGYVFNPKTGVYEAAFPEGQMPTKDTRTATQKDFEYIKELRDRGMNDEADALSVKLKIRQPGSPEVAAAEATFDRENVEATFDRSISTINDILTDPLLEGTGYWRVLSRSLPLSDARAFEGKIRVLQSQAFLNEIEKMKGLGALSEMEGKKVADAVANLDGLQDNKDLRKQITVALNVFQQGKERAMKKLKVQEEQARKKLKSPSSNDQTPSGFSESDFAAAAKQAGVSVEEFRKIVGQ